MAIKKKGTTRSSLLGSSKLSMVEVSFITIKPIAGITKVVRKTTNRSQIFILSLKKEPITAGASHNRMQAKYVAIISG